MLKIIKDLRDLNLSQLCDVYHESNTLQGRRQYFGEPSNLQLLQAEQDFYEYLRLFFQDDRVFCAVWEAEGAYKAALRIEPYMDGCIITALETAPEARRMGYGYSLVTKTVDYLSCQNVEKIYAHIQKKNTASLRLHEKCGFTVCMDHAVYLDGSVLTSSCTVCMDLKKAT